MRVLVIGGTGTVGSAAVEALLARGVDAAVLSRRPDDVDLGRAEIVAGDLANPGGLGPALAGVDAVFMVTPLSPMETELGVAGVMAVEGAGIDRLVYMTVHHLEAASHIPHFGSKIPIVRAIESSGIDYTLIEPNNFFQNDLWFREPIVEHGVYPQPIGGVGCSRVDVRDIAEAATNALLESGHEGRAYPVVGPDVLTGADVAETWSRHLGREVSYAGDDLDAWAEAARGMMPDWMVDDLRIMYEHFQEQGLVASSEDLERTREILGRAPRSFESFVAETAIEWKS